MSKHTPGPWRYVKDLARDGTVEGFNIISPIGFPVVGREGIYGENEADARLIAAAPELLEWVKAALNMVDGDGMPPNWDGMRAAVAAATGEPRK